MRKNRNKNKYLIKKKKSKTILIICLMIIICLIVSISNYKMKERLTYYKKQEKIAEELLEQEKRRTNEIEEYEKYTKTDAYVEDIARDKLSLTYPNEIMFKIKNRSN